MRAHGDIKPGSHGLSEKAPIQKKCPVLYTAMITTSTFDCVRGFPVDKMSQSAGNGIKVVHNISREGKIS